MKKRALVVDDEAIPRGVAENLLKKLGFEVVTASGGKDGLNKYLAGKFDLVVSDFQMPEMDGIEMLGRIFTQNPEQKVIAMSGDSDLSSAANRFGIAYIEKPFTLKQLRLVVAEAMGE